MTQLHKFDTATTGENVGQDIIDNDVVRVYFDGIAVEGWSPTVYAAVVAEKNAQEGCQAEDYFSYTVTNKDEDGLWTLLIDGPRTRLLCLADALADRGFPAHAYLIRRQVAASILVARAEREALAMVRGVERGYRYFLQLRGSVGDSPEERAIVRRANLELAADYRIALETVERLNASGVTGGPRMLGGTREPLAYLVKRLQRLWRYAEVSSFGGCDEVSLEPADICRGDCEVSYSVDALALEACA